MKTITDFIIYAYLSNKELKINTYIIIVSDYTRKVPSK